MENSVNEFKYYLYSERRLSKNTVLNYVFDIFEYVNYLKRRVKAFSDVTTDVIREYLAYLGQKKVHAVSRARKISAIRSFHIFLVEEGKTISDPSSSIRLPKVIQKLPDILTYDEVKKLIAIFDEKTDLLAIRNKAIIEVIYACGLRVSEALGLKLNDLHLDGNYILVTGKGNKSRFVPISDFAIKSLNNYLENVRPVFVKNTTDTVFLGIRGTSLTRQNINIILNEAGIRAQINKNIYPHILRHSFASHLLENGANLLIIQELLGHEDVSTTQIYTHISQKHIRDEYNRYHPRARKEGINEI